MNKICVYTCITGDYDEIKEIKNKEKGIDYYLFTNNKKIKSSTWNVVYIEDKSLSNVLLARKTKIIGNDIVNKYEIVLWMDAAVEFKKDIKLFIKEYLEKGDNFVCFKHGIRNSILEEMDACLKFRKETVDKIDKLKEFYKEEDYKYDNGLIESTVYIKRPSDKKVQETMNLWFSMVHDYTKRDQLSFNYCISKTNLKVKWINEKVFDNTWFKWHQHVFSKYPNDYMIYFGDINNYDFKKQYSANYKKEKNNYIIETTILNDCNKIYIELSNSQIIKYKINKINPKCKIDKQNTIDYFGETYFFKNPGFIILNGDFKKNEKIYLEINFELVREDEKNEFIEYLVNENQIYKNDKISYNDLSKTLESVLNSTSWKITKPLRKITEILKK